MYIEKYWDTYIGGSDDSLTLLEYLAGKEKETISLQEIFADSGLNQMNGEFQQTEEIALPSFAISLYKEYRGQGIGTALMKRMLVELKERGYEKTSLAVQKANYAVRMYHNVGFEIVDENEEEYIMVCELR